MELRNSSKIPCHISDKVKADEVDDIRKSVCGRRKTVMYTDGKHYCSKHRPKTAKIDENTKIQKSSPSNEKISEVDLKEEQSVVDSTATLSHLPKKEDTTSSDEISPSDNGIFSFIVVILGGLFLVVLTVGAFLDAIANAQSLISWNFTLYGSLALLIISIASFSIPSFRQNSRVKQIEQFTGVSRYLMFGGIFVVLWLARVGDFQRWLTPQSTTENQRVFQQDDIVQNYSTPSSVSNDGTIPPAESALPLSKEASNKKAHEDSASKSLTQKLQTPKPENKVSLTRARTLYGRRRYNEAVIECNRILSIEPRNKDALILKANIENTIRILNQ